MLTNRLLAELSSADFALLEPHLVAVDLPIKKSLEKRKASVDHVYFMESGFASVVAANLNKPSIEVGIIGREGMTGLSVLMGGIGTAVYDTYIQSAGAGQRMPADKLRAAIANSHSLHSTLLRFAYSFMIQTSTTALANARSTLEERLARWLLLARDRLDSEELALTHEFIGLMLGTHRPGVTVALKSLEQAGLIATRRGKITILNRAALEKNSNGTYVSPL